MTEPAASDVTRIELASLAARSKNEDFAQSSFALETGSVVAVVVDGATSLTRSNSRIVGYTSEAQWFARELGRQLLRSTHSSPHGNLAFARATASIRETPEYSALQQLGHDDGPTAAFATLRVGSNGTVRVAHLGDCSAAILLRDGSIRILSDESLAQLDNAALEELRARAQALGVTPLTIRHTIQDTVRRHRALANTDRGYWIADPEGRAQGHIHDTTFAQGTVERVLLTTDGFSIGIGPTRPFRTWRHVFDELDRTDADDLLRRVRAFLHEDPELEQVPRFALDDDSTIAYVDFR